MHVVTEKCNGCSACSITCPADAISLALNEKGFYQAFIDEKKCIRCGKCAVTCKKCKTAKYDISEADHYVAVAKDRRILKKSSSGGVAFLLAQKHIELHQGSVYSVGYNAETLNAQHYRYDNHGDLEKSQGSKYLQSYNIEAFKEAVKERGKTLIFGTPCQIAGFREAINNLSQKDDFYLVDIFCHGVPSTKLWRNHVKSKIIIDSDAKPDSPVFRENKNFFLFYKKYKKWYNQDAFLMLFLMTKYLNYPCYSCPYRRKSSADIRLGDLMSAKYGKLWYSPSCICINTDVGRRMLRNIWPELDIFPIAYQEIDDIQQKDNNIDCLISNDYFKLNNLDITPEKLLGKRYYFNYLKSFIKIPLIMIKSKLYTDDLGEIVLRKNI